jgi:hypothetical protein
MKNERSACDLAIFPKPRNEPLARVSTSGSLQAGLYRLLPAGTPGGRSRIRVRTASAKVLSLRAEARPRAVWKCSSASSRRSSRRDDCHVHSAKLRATHIPILLGHQYNCRFGLQYFRSPPCRFSESTCRRRWNALVCVLHPACDLTILNHA